jgi:DNA-binding SARP family transcriptional activator
VSWVESHKESERLASAARIAAQKGDREDAITFYRQAAEAEMQALLVVDLS